MINNAPTRSPSLPLYGEPPPHTFSEPSVVPAPAFEGSDIMTSQGRETRLSRSTYVYALALLALLVQLPEVEDAFSRFLPSAEG